MAVARVRRLAAAKRRHFRPQPQVIMTAPRPRCVLAFSGGLDTSLCVVWLREELGFDVITLTVDTGGFPPEELVEIEQRSKELGAIAHHTIDGTQELYDDWIRYIVAANYLKGGVYPLCVGVERVVQARHLAEIAREYDAAAVAHGSTGAGNDQIRFEIVLRTLAPELELLAPIRSLGWGRAQEAQYLNDHGFDVDASTQTYSINAGLWGVTIGGGETKVSDAIVPETVYPSYEEASSEAPAEIIKLTLEQGHPVAINGEAGTPLELIYRLDEIAKSHGIGRDIHLGETVLGIKGRIAFEAPAATLLMLAHRELEKLVLTKWQSIVKDQVASFYGLFLHEGRYLDPVMRDIEALLESTQEFVSGEVSLRLHAGLANVVALSSPYSLMDANKAAYGEESGLWSGADAEGFARISSIPSMLAYRAQQKSKDE